ncbi:hypothetical protein V6N13_025378 [Hibiscus sabdariffa]
MFVLRIEDEELYLMLEDVHWSYLNEIFQEVVPWSEKISYSERATWLEIRGLPLHCWNCVTLKKIAGLWGPLRHWERTISPPWTANNELVESEKTDKSTSNSKSNTVRSNEEEKVDQSRSDTDEEVFQAMWVERNFINGDSQDKESSRGKLNYRN